MVGAITFMANLIGQFDEGTSRVSAEVKQRQKEFDDLLLEERQKKTGLIEQLTKVRGDMASPSCDDREQAEKIQVLKEQAKKMKAEHETKLIKARAEGAQNAVAEHKSSKKIRRYAVHPAEIEKII